MKKHSILVAGGAGYIGSITTSLLITKEKGRIVVLDSLKRSSKSAVHPKATFVKGDYGSESTLKKLFRKFKFDTVLNFAAEASVAESMTDPYSYFKTNVAKVLTLLNVMAKFNCKRIMFASSSSVYGETKKAPLSEGDPVFPVNPYAESKFISEKILSWYHKVHGFNVIVFRLANVAGATQSLGKDNNGESRLIPTILEVATGGKPFVNIHGDDYDTPDGTCIRDYIHVLDAANAFLSGLKKVDKIGFRIYNVGTGKGHSVYQVIKKAEGLLGRKIGLKVAKRRSGDPSRLILSSKLIKKELGWKPRNSKLENIIKSASSWRIKNGHLRQPGLIGFSHL